MENKEKTFEKKIVTKQAVHKYKWHNLELITFFSSHNSRRYEFRLNDIITRT